MGHRQNPMESCAFQVSCLRPSNKITRRSTKCENRNTWCCAALPPRRIGAVARDMQGALQDALRARVSRVAVELPPGARLGTEKRDDTSRVLQVIVNSAAFWPLCLREPNSPYMLCSVLWGLRMLRKNHGARSLSAPWERGTKLATRRSRGRRVDLGNQ